MYRKLANFPIFTDRAVIEDIIGQPKFPINDAMVYYYGDGLIVAYSSRRFVVRDGKHIEYGEAGEYAITIYHFNDIGFLQKHFRIAPLDFDYKPTREQLSAEIDEIVTYAHTFTEVHKMKVKINQEFENKYFEGETRVLVDGKIVTQNLFVMYGNYTLYFSGGSKKSKVAGFKHMLRGLNIE